MFYRRLPEMATVPRLARTISDHRHPLHPSMETAVIGNCVMLCAPVVPLGDAARLPTEPTGDLESIHLLVQPVAKRTGFIPGHSIDARHEVAIDEERLLSSFGVRSNDRVPLWRVRLFRVFHDLIRCMSMAGAISTEDLLV